MTGKHAAVGCELCECLDCFKHVCDAAFSSRRCLFVLFVSCVVDAVCEVSLQLRCVRVLLEFSVKAWEKDWLKCAR